MNDPSLNQGDDGRRPGNVYFAFKPGPDVTDQVVSVGNRLRIRHGLMGTVSPAVLHVTMCPIGYIPELSKEHIDAARRVGEHLIAQPFEIIFNRVATYQNGQKTCPLVVFADNGVPGAELFRHTLIADLRRSGFVLSKKLARPHMTLFYDRQIVAEEPIDPIRWAVRDVVLVHSIHGASLHDSLGQWPLRTSADADIQQ